ncbi:MAG TPA: isoleucine--tRNA ligase [Myxococcota bacterium]|nr:isoleucine--tRNA ligase [Myxococcota bacterium]
MFTRLERSVELEDRVRAFWDERRIFQRAQEQAQGREAWVFFEGPPTANGTPHNGHVLTRVMKDVFPRFQSMRGRRVLRKAGWDTHGLPVEVEVEKQLGVHGKEAIEAYGLERFNRACVDNVFTYIHEWDELTRDIGFWVDLKDPYVTFHKPYVESVWWALSRLLDKGLLYQGHKVVWWWPQGGTTLSAAEVGLGYKTVDDPAATVRLRDADDPTISYLAWTTTPWTLPSNVALAVSEDVEYAYCEDPAGGLVVVAVDLAASYGLVPLRTVRGAELVGRRYTPLYDFGPPTDGDGFRVVPGHHVTTKSGTGIVHTAPAYGEDDMIIARAQGLGLLQWVGANGRFGPGTGDLEGLFCKDADKPILRDLHDRGLLFKRDTYRHDYPFCWRASEDPLIQFARPAWFIRTTQLKDEALRNNDRVAWHPDHIREGRFGDFLRNNVDWALSRERFWGTPLNIWVCGACDHRVAPTSLADLEARGATGIARDVDEHLRVHRPWIDRVELPCPACGAVMRRVPEVIDCWFDSGAMPFAQWGFPHQNAEVFADQYPADFICEAIDQTRGWFYTLLMISTLLRDDLAAAAPRLADADPVPYRTCVVLGHVCDRFGLKESKSKGNYTSPNLVMRGSTWLWGVPDPELEPGTLGLLKAQVEGLECGAQPVRLTARRDGGAEAHGRLVVAAVKRKDAVHVHPDDLAALGLDPATGGKLWFHLPYDPPGADAFRWLFCAASAPWNNTRLSLRAIQEGQREFLLRLRNVYQFFSIYAEIAEAAGAFDPRGEAPRAPAERAELDRWVLHELDATVEVVTASLSAYQLYEAAQAISAFVDGLSNWYVRRSRARFWGDGPELQDALWTLYEALCAVSRLIAPFVPFLAEALYQGLVVDQGRATIPGAGGAAAEASVHLAGWPSGRADWRFPDVARRMELAREIVSLGLSARTASRIRVRQPLQAVTVVLADPSRASDLASLRDVVLDELNVREVRVAADAETYVSYKVKPDFKALGPKLGKQMKAVAAAIGAMPPGEVKARLDEGELVVVVDGGAFTLTPAEIVVTVEARGGFEAASSPRAVVALHTELDDDLRAEGFVRELQSRVQALRKEEDLGYTERIELRFAADPASEDAIRRFGDGLAAETLCVSLGFGEVDGWTERAFEVEGAQVRCWMRRAGR